MRITAEVDCIPFRGHELWTPLRWSGKVDLAELKGRVFQPHIGLSSAKILGYRLRSGT